MSKCDIKCEWLDRNELIINPDGQVIPCCFFANNMYVSSLFGFPQSYEPQHPFPREYSLVDYPRVAAETTEDHILAQYIEHRDDLNVNNDTLENILDHKWFHDLYDSWDDSDKLSPICKRNCSK